MLLYALALACAPEVTSVSSGDDDDPSVATAGAPAVLPEEPAYGGEASPDGRELRCAAASSAPTRPWWYVFADQDNLDPACTRGASRSLLHTVVPNAHTGPCTVGWSGEVVNVGERRFAGVGTELEWTDLDGYSGIRLRTRGDGGTYRAQLASAAQSAAAGERCQDPDHDYHGVDFKCGDGSDGWTTVTLPFRALKQEGWGTRWELELADIRKFHVVTSRPGDFSCDLWIQGLTVQGGADVRFEGRGAAPPPPAVEPRGTRGARPRRQ